MSDFPDSQQAQAAEPETQPQQLLQYHHTIASMSRDGEQSDATTQIPQYEPQATPEQLYQYHLFMNVRRPDSSSSTPSLSAYPDETPPESTSAVLESIIAILGMVMMGVVGILGFQHMQTAARNRLVPDMSGPVVTMACIPIAVAFFMMLIRCATRRERRKREREGQIALPDDINMDLEAQRGGRGLMTRFWPRERAPLLSDDRYGIDAPPAYEETATQTAGR